MRLERMPVKVLSLFLAFSCFQSQAFSQQSRPSSHLPASDRSAGNHGVVIPGGLPAFHLSFALGGGSSLYVPTKIEHAEDVVVMPGQAEILTPTPDETLQYAAPPGEANGHELLVAPTSEEREKYGHEVRLVIASPADLRAVGRENTEAKLSAVVLNTGNRPMLVHILDEVARARTQAAQVYDQKPLDGHGGVVSNGSQPAVIDGHVAGASKQLGGLQALFNVWSKGPEAIGELVFEARRLGFEGGIFRRQEKRDKGSHYLEPFHGSLERTVFGPPLFHHYVHPILVSEAWDNQNTPGEIWRNVMSHAKSDAVFMWRESDHGYECLMFDYGLGIIDRYWEPVENLERLFEMSKSYGNETTQGSGIGTWLIGKYSYLTRIVSVNDGFIRILDKKPGFFTEEADGTSVKNKVHQTDVKLGRPDSHGVIVHAFVPFEKDSYRGHFSKAAAEDVLGGIETEEVSHPDREEVWRKKQAMEAAMLSSRDVGRDVQLGVHVPAIKNAPMQVVGRLSFYPHDRRDYSSGNGRLFQPILKIKTMKDTVGVHAAASIEIPYGKIRHLKAAGDGMEIRSEQDVKDFIRDYEAKYRFSSAAEIPKLEVVYNAEYDAGELQDFEGVVLEAPRPENQGTLTIESSYSKEKLIVGINRIKRFRFIQ